MGRVKCAASRLLVTYTGKPKSDRPKALTGCSGQPMAARTCGVTVTAWWEQDNKAALVGWPGFNSRAVYSGGLHLPRQIPRLAMVLAGDIRTSKEQNDGIQNT